MFYRAQREPDLEGHVKHDYLNFNHPSWIIDHHRPNLITKISKPIKVWPGALLAQKSNVTDHNRENGHVADKQQLKASKQRLKRETDTIHAREGSEQSYRINFAELQCLRLRQLQYKLVQHTINLRYDALEPSGWAEDLKEYVQALQHYDYMRKHTLQVQDPFIVSGERFIDRLMLQAAMRDKEDEADPLHWANSTVKWETPEVQPKPIGVTRAENTRQTWIKGFRQRLGVAAIGGIFLIVPMWLMVLHRTLYTALVSTTAFVTIFGLVMAFFLDGLMEVLSSTAAYAAVLVVFVGLIVPNVKS